MTLFARPRPAAPPKLDSFKSVDVGAQRFYLVDGWPHVAKDIDASDARGDFSGIIAKRGSQTFALLPVAEDAVERAQDVERSKGAKAQRKAEQVARQKAPHRIDALAMFELFGPRPEQLPTTVPNGEGPMPPLISASAGGFNEAELEALRGIHELAVPRVIGRVRPRRPEVRGQSAILERLGQEGWSFELSDDRQSFAEWHRGGRYNPADGEAIRAVQPFILAELRGEQARCVLPHRGTPEPAWTVSLGGALLCREHLEETR
jgi:hypothetical protein